MTNNEILLYAEILDNTTFAPVVLELANKACELSEKLDNASIAAVLLGINIDYQSFANILGKAGVDKFYVVNNEKLNKYSTALYAHGVLEVIKRTEPAIMLIGATTQGRDLAPRLSSFLNTGLTADCTKLDINDKKQLAATRPTFGGNLMATILCKNMPQMASVRPNVLPKSELNSDKQTQIDYIDVDFSTVEDKVELIEFIKNLQNSEKNLSEAEIIVAGGKGMKTKEGFELIEKLAQLLNASVGASRAAVDIKIATPSIQVGQTGKTVTPKIYIACAISGAIQHVIGMSSSDIIIAINKDEKAPIFNIADFGIVADVFEVLPEWIKLLSNESNS